jgi:hypothetical protein
MTDITPRRVDQSGLKVGQAVTIIALVAAFVLSNPLLVALVGLAQLLGALDSPYGPYRLLYQNVLRPRGIVKPNVIPDNPEPHRFAMLVGAGFNFAGALLIWTNVSALGWALVWVVIVLANLNFWLNFCLGCWMYYQANKRGIPGFDRAPLAQ